MKKTKTRIKKKLDKIVSDIVRSRGSCVRCGNNDYKKLQCAHIMPRTALSTRWDFMNLVCLCVSCHLFWAHKNPVEFTEWIKVWLGETKYNELRRRATMLKHWTIEELEQLYIDFERIKIGEEVR